MILRKNEIVAAELRNSEGRKAILICSVDPGKCRAELKLKGKFRSEYGRTKQDGDVLIFEGEDHQFRRSLAGMTGQHDRSPQDRKDWNSVLRAPVVFLRRHMLYFSASSLILPGSQKYPFW